MNINAEVGVLIDYINKTWERDLLNSLFLPFEVDRIMSILISHRLLAERLCWDFEKDGIYSVRSGYRTLMGDVWTSTEESTSNATHLWKKV